MFRNVPAGALVCAACVLLILCAGCTITKEGGPVTVTQTTAAPAATTAAATPAPTLMPVSTLATRDTALDQYSPSVRDAAFNALLVKASEEIANKTDLVIFEMSQSETTLKVGYSSARLFLAADDLGYTTETYYDQLLKTKASTMENENKRIAYIQFLYLAKNAANHIADAAEAESFGDYQAALLAAITAKSDLAWMERGPDLPIKSRYNRLNVYLSEFIGRMQDNIVRQKTAETVVRYKISEITPGERFPRLPRPG